MTNTTAGSEFQRDPLLWLSELGQALRREGIECSLTEAVGAAAAISHLDTADPVDLYHGLRTVFLADVSHWDAYDRCFWRLWHGDEDRLQPRPALRLPLSIATVSSEDHRMVFTLKSIEKGKRIRIVVRAGSTQLRVALRLKMD